MSISISNTSRIAALAVGAALVLAVAFGGFAAPAQAQLSSAQVQSILSLLQSFGADAATIANVQSALTGGPVTPGTGSTVGGSYTFTRDLTIGSTGADVTALQQALIAAGFSIPAGATGYFGTQTQSAVAAWQASRGITPAAGYFGPVSRNAWNLGGSTGTPGTPSTPGLSGNAGSIQSVVTFTSGVDTKVPEGTTRNVLGFEVEADANSDLALTSVRVVLTPSTTGNGSTRLDRYFDEVEVRQGSTVVGRVSVSSLSRDANNVHTGTISLSNAVVRADQKVRYTIALRANTVVDSGDTKLWKASVDSIRYNDASGAILTYTPGSSSLVQKDGITTEKSSANDSVTLQASPSNPNASQFKVEGQTRSDEYTVFAFRLRGGSSSGDVNVRTIPVSVNLDGDTIGTVIDDLRLQVGGTIYDNYSWNATNAATGTATFTIDEGDLVVRAGDAIDVRLIARFNATSSGWTAPTTISASTTGITAENNLGTSVTISGSATSQTHTAVLAGANVAYVNDSASSLSEGKVREIQLSFDVTAVGQDVVIDRTTFTGNNVVWTLSTSSVGAISTSSSLSSNAQLSGNNYTVYQGETKRFTLTVTASNSEVTQNVWVTLNKVGGTSVSNIESTQYSVIASSTP